jgi:ribonucleoside-diphosphate reductase alpha chain
MISNWTKGTDYPEWMTEESLKTLSRQHLLENETPLKMYKRVSRTMAQKLHEMLGEVLRDSKSTELVKSVSKVDVHEIETKWFDYMWKGWLCPATPILSNAGTKRGFTISCFIERLEDSMDSIYSKIHEMAMLTKMGGGVGVTFDKVRGRGEAISVGGFSEGVIPFMKAYDSAIIAASQGNVRRGSASMNLPVRHKDIKEFLKMRLPIGDVNRQCLNLNHCVTIDDYFMESVESGDPYSREIYAEILSSRMKTGQPYMLFYHNVHNGRPEDMVKRGLKIDGTNICTEIMQFHDKDHTVVCDLASLNLTKWDEFRDDPDIIELSLLFLDANMQLFIDEATGKTGFDNAVRYAKKARALGLGVLGLHTFLQEKNIPFVSVAARSYIHQMSRKMLLEGLEYNKKWGKILGNPEFCDYNRNLLLFAIAPTATNSIISGGVSAGIEPLVGNAWIHKTAKGTFIRRNRTFEKLVQNKYPEYDNESFWNELTTVHKGSVQSLDFLDADEKEVFLTAYEINQLELVNNAAIWQKSIDQGISLNLFFPADVDPKWFSKVHINAWKQGIKSLYYVRTESILARNMNQNTFSDCVMCEG